MRSLSDSDLLNLWESGLRRHPLDRALLALSQVFPETTYDGLADWPLGRRNQALAELHCVYFGQNLQGWTSCASCGEKLEFELDGRVITVEELNNDERSRSDEPIVVNHGTFRLPTSRDLARAAQETDPRLAAIRIVENCRIALGRSPETSTEHEGTSERVPDLRPDSWSDDDLEEIGERMASADPLAETRLTLHCPKCENDWEETLDIVSFLWAEIEARARRLFLEIHTLASAYGWTETEILSLSENRRARYVEMVQS
ncbi:MAG TPA: hypothetical protein VGR71_01685 [Nitrospira sp.]|nr:hypothetical protein [Nitrospira sp.]